MGVRTTCIELITSWVQLIYIHPHKAEKMQVNRSSWMQPIANVKKKASVHPSSSWGQPGAGCPTSALQKLRMNNSEWSRIIRTIQLDVWRPVK